MGIRKYILSLAVVLFCLSMAHAQNDSIRLVKYTPDFKFNDGIFLNFNQVLNNSAIDKSKIETKEDLNSIDFFKNILSAKTIILYDANGMKREIPVSDIWGYSNQGVLYIQYNDEFSRVPIVGSLSHFVMNVTVQESRFADPFNPYYNPYLYDPMQQGGRYSSTELRQYIIDFKTGNIVDFSKANLKILLMQDAELYEEYNNLSRRKQRKMIFFFLRRFNDRNPLLIPVHEK